MAGTIKTKAQLYADAVALPNPITRTALVAHLDNIVASYENIIQEYTTVQRDALTPFEGQKIYNTTSNRLEYYSASMWLPCSQKETVAVDCSANPNYPEALVGDQYIVTVAGIIGGGSGKTVSVGDLVYCVAPNAGGTEGSVGPSWKVCYSTGSQAQLKKATVTLSAAQVLALGTTPVTIVAAVAGKAIQIVSGSMQSTYVSADYSVTGGSVFIGVAPSARQADFDIEFSGNVYRPIRIYPTPIDNSMIVNTAVAISAATVVTLGDSPIVVTVFYLEV